MENQQIINLNNYNEANWHQKYIKISLPAIILKLNSKFLRFYFWLYIL